MIDVQYSYSPDIYHYGVLGMKWGVRHDRSKAYRKASNKANKLHKTYEKANVRSSKANAKSSKVSVKLQKSYDRDKQKANGELYTSSSRTKKLEKKQKTVDKKASKATHQTSKAYKQFSKWEKSMRKAFKNVKISEISEKDLAAGRDYIYMLLNDRIGR